MQWFQFEVHNLGKRGSGWGVHEQQMLKPFTKSVPQLHSSPALDPKDFSFRGQEATYGEHYVRTALVPYNNMHSILELWFYHGSTT